MVSGIDSAASGMIAQQMNIDVIANNLANVNTAGFKELIPVFKNFNNVNVVDVKENNKNKSDDNDFISETDNIIGTYSTGSVMDSTILDLQQGALRKTDNKLDFAINGNGFFAVGTNNGDCYTRDGSFVVNSEGNLVTKDGNPVLNQGGSAIKLDIAKTGINDLNVTNDGTIYLNNKEVDKLKIVDFNNASDIKTIGNSLYQPVNNNVQPIEAKNFEVNQGFIEGSNANVIGTMINSISATRTYETLSKVLKTTESTLEKAVNDVGRIKE